MEGERLSQANILVRNIEGERRALSVRTGDALPKLLKIDGYGVERWAFDRDRAMPAAPTDRTVQLVVPMAGQVEAITEGFCETARPGAAILLARPLAATLFWSAQSCGVIISLPRQRLQAHASRLFETPLRVAPVNAKLDGLDGNEELIDIVRSLWNRPLGRLHGADDAGLLTRKIAVAVVQALERQSSPPGLTLARSVKRAVDHVRAAAPNDLAIERLAAAAGVTERTLRDNFRAVLGQSVQTFVQQARLQWAHDRLASAQDHRSIETFAAATGFKSSGSFARAYQKLFCETPSLTRARAVKAAGKL
jgi:AraC-like DNA-binding protein